MSANLVLKKLLALNQHLEGKNYMVGDGLTLADVSLVTTCLNIFRHHLDVGK